ncbi:MAG: hypothetical protein LBI08_00305 [Methanomassiliicoccaceae archaeon]|jgi:hypothetical protein|nr:hypothetical protein [Methanomassiliicoccaceae archaeon]
MEDRPKIVILASILALVGAFFALAVAVIGLDVNADGLLSKMAFSLLTLALFLAIAGSLNMNGQWTWRFLIFAEALCAAVPIAGCAYGAIDLTACICLVLIAVVIILITTTTQVRRWVEADRV